MPMERNNNSIWYFGGTGTALPASFLYHPASVVSGLWSGLICFNEMKTTYQLSNSLPINFVQNCRILNFKIFDREGFRKAFNSSKISLSCFMNLKKSPVLILRMRYSTVHRNAICIIPSKKYLYQRWYDLCLFYSN